MEARSRHRHYSETPRKEDVAFPRPRTAGQRQDRRHSVSSSSLLPDSPEDSDTAGLLGEVKPYWPLCSVGLFILCPGFSCLMFETVSHLAVETALELTMCTMLVSNLW